MLRRLKRLAPQDVAQHDELHWNETRRNEMFLNEMFLSCMRLNCTCMNEAFRISSTLPSMKAASITLDQATDQQRDLNPDQSACF
jgi:hypothetical protein